MNPLQWLFSSYHRSSGSSLPRRIYQAYLRSPGLVRWHFGMRLHSECPVPQFYYNVATILMRWVLVDRIERLKQPRMLEIGVGAYALLAGALYQGFRLPIDCCDNEEWAVEWAKRHAELNECQLNVFYSDLFSGVEEGKRYDLIFWNTPYHIPNRRFLPGLFAGAVKHLANRGELVICYKTATNRAETLEILSDYPNLEVREIEKWWWNPIEVLIIGRKL